MAPHAYDPHMTTILSRVIPAIFGVIGLVVIVSLWTAKGFGEPPLFFKLVGSLIASTFVLVGVAGALGLQPKAAAADPSTLSSALGAASSTAARPAAATPTAMMSSTATTATMTTPTMTAAMAPMTR